MSRVTRLLQREELLSILPTARDIFNDVYSDLGDFDAAHFLSVWDAFIRRKCGEIVVEVLDEPVGAYGTVFSRHLYTGKPVVDVLFFVVHPDHRNGRVGYRLLKDLQSRYTDAAIRMTTQHRHLGKLLRRLGWTSRHEMYTYRSN